MKLAKTFRLYPELVARLERHARRQRRSLTAVVEAALDKYLAVAEESANGALGAVTGEANPRKEVDLAQWLSRRTGVPKAICLRHLELGRITVDGEVHRGPSIAKDAVGQVRLDGNPV